MNLDPQPYVDLSRTDAMRLTPGEARTTEHAFTFSPRPGYEQEESKYL